MKTEQIYSYTARIAGCIHMCVEKIQLCVNDILGDDKTYFYADVDEKGKFVFENLDLRKFGSGKCDMQIGICCGYDKENNFLTTLFLHEDKKLYF